MRLDRGTQKQIAQRFKGNLDYFKKPHYWRRLRFLTILLVTFGGVAGMAVYYFLGPETFYNAGPISRPHAHFANDCQKCHEPHGSSWTLKAADSGALDAACQKCHAGHAFHEPNVARDHSCTACHHEHLGPGPMPAPSDANCRSCHNTPHEMAAAIDRAKTIPAAAFNFRPDRGLVVYHAPRPPAGYAKIFAGFADGHPDFRFIPPNSATPTRSSSITKNTSPTLTTSRCSTAAASPAPTAISRPRPVNIFKSRTSTSTARPATACNSTSGTPGCIFRTATPSTSTPFSAACPPNTPTSPGARKNLRAART